ncbi:MAG: 4-(cytidine 5'-diphospho)-2-C-methyl-D-erythritol kinase, partial [Dehalococcoidia bacterium]|nr:4-(cytidine 5'-diphospho)-2-C-methyl-D-erythritol kinase [Dehalococcoidia bacterium]
MPGNAEPQLGKCRGVPRWGSAFPARTNASPNRATMKQPTPPGPGRAVKDTGGAAWQPRSLLCPAKVNLTLEVLGRYPNGYHRISSVMQTVSLSDVLSISPADEISFDCDRPSLATPDNLVMRAASLIKETSGYAGGAHLRLEKRIPETAGLGGGSSDAAAALVGLNEAWDLSLPPAKLMEMASALGSDVPFFVLGGAAVAEGRGEQLTPLPGLDRLWLVLLHPPISLKEKTRTLYEALRHGNYTYGEHTAIVANAVRAGQKLTDEMLFNVFELVADSV